MITSIYCTEYLKYYFSEKQKMERLRQDLIKKSKLVKSSSQTRTSSSSKRVQKIYNFALRGGSESQEFELLFDIAKEIRSGRDCLLAILETKAYNQKKLNVILWILRLYLRWILLLWKIHVTFIFDTQTNQFGVMTAVLGGGTAGFITAWIGVGSTLLVANGLGVLLLGRGLFQHVAKELAYQKLQNEGVKFLENEKVQDRIVRIAEKIEDNKQKVKTLYSEEDPAIKRTAESLGIFKEKPITGPIKSTQNVLEKRYFEKLKKGIEKVLDVEADSDMIDVDFINQDRPINIPPIRIRD